MAASLMFLLLAITAADFVVASKQGHAPDESVISLLAMSISGVVGIVSGYLAGKPKE